MSTNDKEKENVMKINNDMKMKTMNEYKGRLCI